MNKNSKINVVFITLLSIACVAWSQVMAADALNTSADESPEIVLERASSHVLTIINKDYELLRKDPAQVNKIVQDYILPLIDDVTMAKLAMGKYWKKASREQKISFVNEFRNLLLRTYSKSLIEFKDQKVVYFPLKLPAGTTKASVRADVIQAGGPVIPIAYRVRVKNNAWKVYDIKIDGISLVTSYRGTFTQEIRKSGIDGLLDYLRKKNTSLGRS